MSLKNWLQNSWLVQHTTSREEIANLLAISDRDLAACQVKQLPSDWRFAIAYNAALQAATAVLAAAGYRASRDNHHYRVIQALEFTVAPGSNSLTPSTAFARSETLATTIWQESYPIKKQMRCCGLRSNSDPMLKNGSRPLTLSFFYKVRACSTLLIFPRYK